MKPKAYWTTLLLILGGCVDMVGPRPRPLDMGYDVADADDVTASDTSPPDAGDADMGADLAVEELHADPGPNVAADVDAFVLLDGSGSTGAVSYQWDFGNGTGWDGPRTSASANVAYHEQGRYEAVLTAFDAAGNSETASKTVTVTLPVMHAPVASSTVTAFGGDRAAVVSPDSNELLVVERGGIGFDVRERLQTDRGPRTVASLLGGEWLVVPCREDATVLYLRTNRTGEQRRVFLPLASQPYAAVARNGRVYVTLQGTGQLVEIEDRAGVPTVTRTVDVVEDARGLALLPDGRLVVSRWRSPDTGGELAIVASDLSRVDIVGLAADPGPTTADHIGGVPSYLGTVAVSPNGLTAAVPSEQVNIVDGAFRDGTALTPQTTLRAALSVIDLPTVTAPLERRTQWAGQGLASAAVYSPRGDYLYVAMRGTQTIQRLDTISDAPDVALSDVGRAIEGLAVSADGRWLFADAFLSRELVVYQASTFDAEGTARQRIDVVMSEPLDAQLLQGKQLFNDGGDPRISAAGIACSDCHMEGDSDRRVWDFTDRGEGLRNTISLLGRAGTADGPLQWTAAADEVQDVENEIRDGLGGTGLMSDVDLAVGTRAEPLGESKAGLSADLDALAVYVTSLDRHLPSPERLATGELSAAAQAGETLFATLGCDGCHAQPRTTDSALVAGSPILHDVGTIGPGSGTRLGEALVGLDTPTLRGVWNTPPYLHDGSAATLEDVVTTRNAADAHGPTSALDATQIGELTAYLRSLDYR